MANVLYMCVSIFVRMYVHWQISIVWELKLQTKNQKLQKHGLNFTLVRVVLCSCPAFHCFCSHLTFTGVKRKWKLLKMGWLHETNVNLCLWACVLLTFLSYSLSKQIHWHSVHSLPIVTLNQGGSLCPPVHNVMRDYHCGPRWARVGPIGILQIAGSNCSFTQLGNWIHFWDWWGLAYPHTEEADKGKSQFGAPCSEKHLYHCFSTLSSSQCSHWWLKISSEPQLSFTLLQTLTLTTALNAASIPHPFSPRWHSCQQQQLI